MKQIIFITLLIISIPYFIVSFFMEEKEIKYDLESNIQVRIKREETNVIEEISLEEYITGVVAGEMPVAFNIEALKAGAVAARTYALKRIIANQDNEYDLVDTVLNQVYLDDDHLRHAWQEEYVSKINKLKAAVYATKGEYLTYEGEIIDALYFSTSNGYTENSEEVFSFALPYLRSVKSMWDEKASPVFNDQESFTIYDFYQKLSLPYKEKVNVEVLKTTATGRVISLKINDKTFNGRDLAKKLSLRSNDFKIIQEKENIYVQTKGYGHGVGMSQYGANGMAEAGYKYDEILKHYYQKVSLKKL